MSVGSGISNWGRFAPTAFLSVATLGAAGLVVTGAFPETASPRLFQQTVLSPSRVVVCLRDGCGCDKRPLTWIENAAKQNKPVLVLLDAAEVSPSEEQAFRQALPKGDVTFLRTRSATVLKRYAPSGRSTLTLTRYGVLATQSAESGAETMLIAKGAIR